MMLALQMLQHVWTYKQLVHDALGMHSNSITIEPKAEPGQLPGASNKKRYEVSHMCSFLLWQHEHPELMHVLMAVTAPVSILILAYCYNQC